MNLQLAVTVIMYSGKIDNGRYAINSTCKAASDM